MTKRHLTTALLFSAMVPHAALAHPGDHGGMAPLDLVRHLWTSPFHILFVIASVAVLAGAMYVLRKGGRFRRD